MTKKAEEGEKPNQKIVPRSVEKNQAAPGEKWRRHHADAEKNHCSRCKLCVAVVAKKKADRINHDAFIAETNAPFKKSHQNSSQVIQGRPHCDT